MLELGVLKMNWSKREARKDKDFEVVKRKMSCIVFGNAPKNGVRSVVINEVFLKRNNFEEKCENVLVITMC
jgi:hypothetical protein